MARGFAVTTPMPGQPATCFFERDPGMSLVRRATAEGAGTLLLMLAATGSGLMAQSLSRSDPMLGILVGALATAGALVGLIVAFGAVSGGHFNPLITGLQWLAGERGLGCTLAYAGAQLVGAAAGALLASLMFRTGASHGAMPVIGARLVISEAVATAGLMIVVFGCARSGRAESGPFAVGAWLAAAIVATPSTSNANPAITLGSLLAAGPIGLSGGIAASYVAAEIAGALIALAVISLTYPRKIRRTSARSDALTTAAAQ